MATQMLQCYLRKRKSEKERISCGFTSITKKVYKERISQKHEKGKNGTKKDLWKQPMTRVRAPVGAFSLITCFYTGISSGRIFFTISFIELYIKVCLCASAING